MTLRGLKVPYLILRSESHLLLIFTLGLGTSRICVVPDFLLCMRFLYVHMQFNLIISSQWPVSCGFNSYNIWKDLKGVGKFLPPQHNRGITFQRPHHQLDKRGMRGKSPEVPLWLWQFGFQRGKVWNRRVYVTPLSYRINKTDIWSIRKFGQPTMKLKWKMSFVPFSPSGDQRQAPEYVPTPLSCGVFGSALTRTGSTTFLKGHIHCTALEPFFPEDSTFTVSSPQADGLQVPLDYMWKGGQWESVLRE